MTPEEIIQELERFKDRVNAEGKATLDRLKDELKPYLEPKPPEQIIVEKPVEKIIEKEILVEKPVVAEGDRRTEPRDPAEHDQHVAEALGYVKKPRG